MFCFTDELFFVDVYTESIILDNDLVERTQEINRTINEKITR
jgi:hypothetical protein